jgi:hypothetical protein
MNMPQHGITLALLPRRRRKPVAIQFYAFKLAGGGWVVALGDHQGVHQTTEERADELADSLNGLVGKLQPPAEGQLR